MKFPTTMTLVVVQPVRRGCRRGLPLTLLMRPARSQIHTLQGRRSQGRAGYNGRTDAAYSEEDRTRTLSAHRGPPGLTARIGGARPTRIRRTAHPLRCAIKAALRRTGSTARPRTYHGRRPRAPAPPPNGTYFCEACERPEPPCRSLAPPRCTTPPHYQRRGSRRMCQVATSEVSF